MCSAEVIQFITFAKSIGQDPYGITPRPKCEKQLNTKLITFYGKIRPLSSGIFVDLRVDYIVKSASMTQLVINIEDLSIVPHLKRILSAIKGVSVYSSYEVEKPGIEEALKDVKEGNVYHAESVQDMFGQILG